MKPFHIIAPLTAAWIFYLSYLDYAANLRAESYKLMYEDAAEIVSSQSHAIDNAQLSLERASDVLSTCIIQMRPQ